MYKESYNVENMKYELTLEVDRDEISDDQTGQIMQRVKQMAQRAAEHKDSPIAILLANGDAATSLCYDGQPFFSDSHSSGDSRTQDNKLAPDAVDPTDPTVAEWKAAIKAGATTLLGLKDDKGGPMNQSATGLVAVVPPQQFFAAHQALAASVIDSTTNVLSGAAKVVAFSRLADASKWFLLKTDVALRPFIFQDREPIELKSLEADSEPGFLREVFLYGVRARYRMAYVAWQHAVQLDFA